MINVNSTSAVSGGIEGNSILGGPRDERESASVRDEVARSNQTALEELQDRPEARLQKALEATSSFEAAGIGRSVDIQG